MKKILVLLLIVIVFINAKCRKDNLDNNVLPPVTQSGKNTIGFKLNEEVWLPYYKCTLSGDPCGEISARYGPPYNNIDHFSFQGTRNLSDNRSSLSITSITPITTLGNKYDSVFIEFRTGNGINLGTSYTKSLFHNLGVFEITRIDPASDVISGIFSFKLYNTIAGITDSVVINDGRFDFKMNACVCR